MMSELLLFSRINSNVILYLKKENRICLYHKPYFARICDIWKKLQ